ncbi:uncharacterized protein LOC121711937 isoform X2 [Alosa sapidissima]|uniref:uncharacterized protein LOC121711937 isoform X2 n=1 Tax=Alosa sapidissima TaxID=34773 RepID=UPI001C09560A|nr:uncharacterized protein LOC121711937 isoform X2 [Alosa sapidissima]
MVRRCFFRCEGPSPLYGLPKVEPLRTQWLEFIFNSIPATLPNIYLCPNHFTDNCFKNLGLFTAGFSKLLALNEEAVPTLCGPMVEDISSQHDLKPPHPSFHHVGCQTDSPQIISAAAQTNSVETRSMGTQCVPLKMKSVSTQLSWGSLKVPHIRSKGIQTKVPLLSVGTGTASHFPDLPVTSTLIKGGPGLQSRKKPPLELEEGDTSNEYHMELDSTYTPGDSVLTEESDALYVLCIILYILCIWLRILFMFIRVEEILLSKNVYLILFCYVRFETQVTYDEAKYIVFESCLKQLFENCPVCKRNCDVQRRRMGTYVAFTQFCPHCNYFRQWESQPIVGSTPVGNLQLSAATYFTGSSFIQLEKVFKAMQLQIFQYDTFRRHARNYLEPAIIHKWKMDQQNLFHQQLHQGGKVALGGDMRADLPGHSAKFGSYTLMNLESNTIMDIQLVQSNEVGGSYHMEKEGLRRCLDLLESNGLAVDYIVTDRHPQIQKYLRERNIVQFYNVRHFEKGLSKKLEKLQNKDCNVLKRWLPSIKNHVYWCATSSSTGPEKVAKWTSLLNHLQNVHVHEDPLFPKCLHPDRVSRDPNKWLQPGSVALYKAEKILNNKRVLKDVEKLSHHHPTSTLESFHSLILRFAPKNVVFTFMGMLCRLYLAAMHYNENAGQEQAVTSAGQAVYKLVLPKSKTGEGIAKPIKTDSKYKYVEELMRLVIEEVFEDPTPFVEEMQKIPIPPDLSSV